MQTEVGIFNSRQTAEQAVRQLLDVGIPSGSITFLSGECADSELEHIPTTDTERDGMGKTMGAFLGGVTGAGAGLGLGSAVASLVIPGVGPIIAIGIGAAALLGLGGAAAGTSIGGSSETALDQGTPRDDVPLYHHLLKNRRSLVVVNVDSEEQARTTRRLLDQRGAENIDDARHSLKVRHDPSLRQAS